MNLLPPQPAVANLDAPCSRHFVWRQLLECGETWQRLASAGDRPSLPQQPQTWQALADLAQHILDPLVDCFGPLQLTYCFAPAGLTRHVPGRIAPALDQHAGYELRRDGKAICPRGGQAVDCRASAATTYDLVAFALRELPFDRLYYYGPDRPLHISYGPNHDRSAWRMVAGPSGRLLPRRW